MVFSSTFLLGNILGKNWLSCTFIALVKAKLFSVNNNATANIGNEPSTPPVWLGILRIAIQAGNSVDGSVTGGQPILIGGFID